MSAARSRPGRHVVGERPRDERVRGDVGEQVVPTDQHPPLRVPEDRVGGAVARAMEHLEAPVAQCQRVAVVELPVDGPARSERPERSPHRPERGGEVPGHSVAAHHRLGELVVGRGADREVPQVRAERVQAGHLRARAAGEDLEQPEVIHVLVGEHDQLEVLDRVAECGQPPLELVERLARVRPSVYERQRLVLDQVAVDAPDQERSGDGQLVDAGPDGARQRLRGGGGRLVGEPHDRITARTSSRFCTMCSCERSDSRHSRRRGSVFDERTLKCQSS